ncbi:hypothetical protein CRUP_016156 [Coryphaenoides rupestris]|nr:hypothetical protein CRUP_016156 [Coryphaenoides rupestris]
MTRVVLANLLSLLLLSASLSVLYVWTSLDTERVLERSSSSSSSSRRTESRPDPPQPDPLQPDPLQQVTDPPSAKTLRALLAVPGVHRGGGGGGRGGGLVHIHHNLTGSGGGRSPDHQHNDAEQQEKEDVMEQEEVTEQEVEEEGGGCFWSRRLEEQLPAGFTEPRGRAWRERVRAQRVVRLEPGCGRTSNQLATLADGGRACVRYGINADQVQGEALTACLAALLGITNLPPVALSRLGGVAGLGGAGGGAGGGGVGGEQWAAVRRRVEALQWSDRAVVSLTEWVANLTGVVTPDLLRQQEEGAAGGTGGGGGTGGRAGRGVGGVGAGVAGGGGGDGGLHPLRPELRNKTRAELLELAQWSDLILLDYVTANFDRLVSSLFSRQWDPRVMERHTNNLLRVPAADLLVFLDNEAGLVHGYRVLDMWERYHEAALASVCVFRRRTARRVAELHGRRDAAARLLRRYRDTEPLLAPVLGFLSEEHAGLLQARVDRVHRHIQRCQEKYPAVAL